MGAINDGSAWIDREGEGEGNGIAQPLSEPGFQPPYE